MNLFPWPAFLPEGFENGIIQRFWTGDYMAWRQHFTFCRFSRKRKFFGNFDYDFRKCFTKGFFWLNMKNFKISVLTTNSWYLQADTLKNLKTCFIMANITQSMRSPVTCWVKYVERNSIRELRQQTFLRSRTPTDVTRTSVNVLCMCLYSWGQVADTRTQLLKFKIERKILVLESSHLGKNYLVISDVVVKLLA